MKLAVKTTLSDKTSVDDIIAHILRERGINKDTQPEFFHPRSPTEITYEEVGIDELELKKALLLLEDAHKEKKRVVVWCDYDVDGVMGGAIMWLTLRDLGFDVMPYISDRKTEGYGFSAIGVNKVIEKFSPQLIITVDHGISGEEHIHVLKEKNIPVIIADHHLKTASDPVSASALLYTTKICGAAVSYFAAREFVRHFKEKKLVGELRIRALEKLFDHDFIVMSGIATIADMMKLLSFSRSLSYHGLRLLPKVQNIGLAALLQTAGVSTRSQFSSFDVGFIIGPRINAAGRMGDAIVALRLLCTNNPSYARNLAIELEEQNKTRQRRLSEQMETARQLIAREKDNKIYFIYSDTFDEGIVGLIAARIMREHYRPTLVAVLSDGHLKGSARSIYGVHIVDILKECRDLLDGYGGHEMAGGFSLRKEAVKEFSDKLASLAQKYVPQELLEETIEVDLETGFHNLTIALAEKLSLFGPFGSGNEEPVFYSKNVTISSVKYVGKTSDHVQLYLRDQETQMALKAIFFNGARRVSGLDKTRSFGVVYKITIDSYRGKKELVLQVREII